MFFEQPQRASKSANWIISTRIALASRPVKSEPYWLIAGPITPFSICESLSILG